MRKSGKRNQRWKKGNRQQSTLDYMYDSFYLRVTLGRLGLVSNRIEMAYVCGRRKSLGATVLS